MVVLSQSLSLYQTVIYMGGELCPSQDERACDGWSLWGLRWTITRQLCGPSWAMSRGTKGQSGYGHYNTCGILLDSTTCVALKEWRHVSPVLNGVAGSLVVSVLG